VPYDPDKTRSTIFWFDGASNVQKAGKILQAKVPRSYSLHGGEHVVSLFFGDIAKIKERKVTCSFCTHFHLLLTCFLKMQVLVLKACRLYNTFGSGAIHGIYAHFMAQSAIHNKGRKIGLLQGATSRFATWCYAMMRLLRMKDPLLSTVHLASFKDLEKTDVIHATIFDITDPKFFKAL
jgi:hypothetical protein